MADMDMLNVGDIGLIKAKIVRIEMGDDNQIIYKVKMPIEDGWEEVLFPIKPINIVETKRDTNE